MEREPCATFASNLNTPDKYFVRNSDTANCKLRWPKYKFEILKNFDVRRTQDQSTYSVADQHTLHSTHATLYTLHSTLYTLYFVLFCAFQSVFVTLKMKEFEERGK